jgi:putative ATP-dependent endonuclease of the OLD family
MKLIKARLRNFRCFKTETSINFDDITALVGKNDSGKSTILEALDKFLNEGMPDKHDASKSGDAADLTIICEFGELPQEVIIDDKNPTDLKNEYLLNQDGRLEIHKTYSGHLQSPKLTTVSAYAFHPSLDKVNDLRQLKNNDLKKRAKELKIDLTGIDSKVNAEIRERIRSTIGELDLLPQLIPLNEENAKRVWDGLRNYIPAFALFKSDRPSTDQDPEAQDPLKAAVKEAIKEKENELNNIAEYVENEVKKIAKATLDKLREMDSSLATELKPEFSTLKWDQLFKTSITGDDNIPINKRGSGVKRLILLNFFRAKAEQQVKEKGKPSVIYGIEEPETSQHPNNQRMLLRAFTDLSKEFQVILSTHTPVLAKCLPDHCLRYINVREDKEREVLSGGGDTNIKFSKSLGILPDHNVKLFIGVEGKHDITFLQNITKVLRTERPELPDLLQLELEGAIIFFPLGGSNLALWTSRLKNLNRPEFHLYDRDNPPPGPAKYQAVVDEINSHSNCKAMLTEKREMENYLHRDAIVSAYNQNGVDLSITSNFSDFSDVPQEVAIMVHNKSDSDKTWEELSTEKRNDKILNAKKILNSIAPQFMTMELLKEIDQNDDLLSWLNNINEMLTDD